MKVLVEIDLSNELEELQKLLYPTCVIIPTSTDRSIPAARAEQAREKLLKLRQRLGDKTA